MTKRGLWYLDKGGIRRPVYRDGSQSQERYPIRRYRHLLGDEKALEQLVIRLNQPTLEQRAKAAVKIKHAFISEELLEEYRAERSAQLPSQDRAACEYFYLREYFLNFFIGKLNLVNPVDWHRVHKTVWAEYLKGPDVPGAASTKKEIVQVANRFMAWLHDRRPDEVKPLRFTPLTKETYKYIEAKRKQEGQARSRRYIPVKDWEKIRDKAGTLTPYVLLAACYGLRRSEVLGLKPEDVSNHYLNVVRQLHHLTPEPAYEPLKGREARRVEHWYMTPDQAHQWIEDMSLVHPDTLTDHWRDLMLRLGLTYDFHDLRHTYVTLAIRDFAGVDVMHAAGHKNIETTMAYLHDDRNLDDEESA